MLEPEEHLYQKMLYQKISYTVMTLKQNLLIYLIAFTATWKIIRTRNMVLFEDERYHDSLSRLHDLLVPSTNS